jgi:hypothetical protein
MIFLRALAVWVVIVAVEFIHGTMRVLFLEPVLGAVKARQIAVFTGSALIVAAATVFIRWISAETISRMLAVGLLWLVCMLVFETSFGHFIMGYSWQRIAADYNLCRGGLLPIGMTILFFAPLLAARIRHLI